MAVGHGRDSLDFDWFFCGFVDRGVRLPGDAVARGGDGLIGQISAQIFLKFFSGVVAEFEIAGECFGDDGLQGNGARRAAGVWIE